MPDSTSSELSQRQAELRRRTEALSGPSADGNRAAESAEVQRLQKEIEEETAELAQRLRKEQRKASSAAAKLCLLLAMACLLPASLARADGEAVVIQTVPHHPLEDQALNEPESVLAKLPALLLLARKDHDSREVALLLLAKANACRVIADWPCQRLAGAGAREAALAARDPLLIARGAIAESRAAIAMQDFTRGEQLLGQAELELKTSPSPELSADIYLAYSSLSNSLGKQALSAEYAERGLKVLNGDVGLPTQARLLRNLARAQAQLGQLAQADQTLARAQLLSEQIDDPKLSAELLIGAARMGRQAGNVEAQVKAGERVLELGRKLKNSQLSGMGHEVLGLAALDGGDDARAIQQLDLAYRSFRELGLKRDEARVLHELIRVSIVQKRPRAVLDAMTARYLEIDSEIESKDRAKAADDFDARVQYAQRELEVLRLNDEAALSRERERALAASNRQSRALVLLTGALLFVLAVFYILQRRSNQQLSATLARLRESEAQAGDLLNLSAGFVFIHDLEGRLLLVNPAAAVALGQSTDSLVGRQLQEFQPRAGRSTFTEYLSQI